MERKSLEQHSAFFMFISANRPNAEQREDDAEL